MNSLLAEARFDEYVEGLCAKFYAGNVGRPGLAPGVYVRMLLVGYFEGITSERGIAWRCADSLALRGFLGLTLSECPPDHSTVSRSRRLIDLETHVEIFSFVLKLLAKRGLANGQTVGVDASTLEANAAMKSLVRRDTGQSYDDFLIS
ncbi:MAG: transposase [bacterium]|nr:transposase [bacterium]